MKLKKLVGLLIVTMFVIGLIPTVAFAAVDDPYSTPIQALSFDSKASGYLSQAKTDRLQMDTNPGRWVCYKNVKFVEGTYAIVFSAATAESEIKANNNTFEFRIDSPSNNAIVTIPVATCAGWGQPMDYVGQINQEIVGYHDVYISGAANKDLYNFYFLKRSPGEESFVPYSVTNTFSDIVGLNYQYEMETITSLGFIEGMTENLYDAYRPVFRYEFASYLAKLMISEVPESKEQIFSDVIPGEEYTNEINYLYNNGILTLNSEKKFNPYSYITVRDAAVMALRFLGYDEMCKYDGGYPYGYDLKAREIGLYDREDAGSILRKDVAAVILYNVAKAPYLYVAGVDNGVPVYEYKENILETTLNVYNKICVVEATSVGGIAEDVSVPDGGVYIDSELYYTGYNKVNSLLGVECEIFYTKDAKGKRTLLSIHPVDTVEDVIISTANGDKITTLERDKIVYKTEKGKKEEIKIPSKALWSYNHRSLSKDISDVIKANDFRGTIRVIDNGSGYETVIVENYVNIKLDSFDFDKFTFTDSLTGKIFTFDSDVKFRFSDGTNILAKTRLQKDSIAQLYVSENNDMVTLLFTDTVITGAASEISSENKVKINDVYYNLASEFDLASLHLGTNSEFHLNYYGEIVYAKLIAGNNSVGYLVGFEKTEDEAHVNIMTGDNTIQRIPVAESVYVEGIHCKDYDELYEGKKSFIGFKNMEKTVLLYQKNADGKISMIDTPNVGAGNSMDMLKEIVPLDENNPLRYNPGVSVLSTDSKKIAYPVLKSGKFIMIDAIEPYVSSKFYTISSFSSGESFGAAIYSTTGDESIGDLVFVPQNPNLNSSGIYTVVISADAVVTKNDKRYLQVEVMKGGILEKLLVAEENTTCYEIAKSLRPGDCIKYWMNFINEVDNIRVGYFVDGVEKRNGIEAYSSENKPIVGNEKFEETFLAGKISEIRDGYVKMDIYNSTPIWIYIGSPKVFRLLSDGTVQTGLSSAVLNAGDRIIVHSSGSVQFIVIN